VTRNEFKVLVKAMKAVYANDTFIPDQDAFNVWYELLKDLPYEVANLSVQKYMVTERFPPTIADIRKHANEIVSDETDELNEAAAWGLVYKAIGNSIYNAEKEFEKLPLACRRAVGSPQMLRSWAQMDMDTVQSYQKDRFMRTYRREMDALKEQAKLPPAMRKLMAEVAKGKDPDRITVMQKGEEDGEIKYLQQRGQTNGGENPY
jgi:hypothetical protein